MSIILTRFVHSYWCATWLPDNPVCRVLLTCQRNFFFFELLMAQTRAWIGEIDSSLSPSMDIDERVGAIEPAVLGRVMAYADRIMNSPTCVLANMHVSAVNVLIDWHMFFDRHILRLNTGTLNENTAVHAPELVTALFFNVLENKETTKHVWERLLKLLPNLQTLTYMDALLLQPLPQFLRTACATRQINVFTNDNEADALIRVNCDRIEKCNDLSANAVERLESLSKAFGDTNEHYLALGLLGESIRTVTNLRRSGKSETPLMSGGARARSAR